MYHLQDYLNLMFPIFFHSSSFSVFICLRQMGRLPFSFLQKSEEMESITKQPAVSNLCALVTGANKGIGLATVCQLAQQGITVVLSARDEKRGMNAVETLQREFGLSSVVFHQLDVQDPLSIANLAKYIKAHFGKLDILVNSLILNDKVSISSSYLHDVFM